MTNSKQSGFSLIELSIAMTVTLIIAGAVFQLMTAGQGAFQREPQLSDRQLNIRVAIDAISRDLFQVGYGVPQFAQVLTENLDGVGPMGPSGADTDEIEMFMAKDCPHVQVCQLSGVAVFTKERFASTACFQVPTLVLMANDTTWGMRWLEDNGNNESASQCSGAPGGTKGGKGTFPPGQAPLVNPPGGGWNSWNPPPQYMMVGQAIRYRINVGPDGIPNLERSELGGRPDLDGNSSWMAIARGVEDLQVEYLNGTGWQDEPGTISCGLNCASPTQADLDTLVRRVRIRLSSRATGEGRIAGETTSAVGNAVRGELVTEVAPRAVVATLGMASGEM